MSPPSPPVRHGPVAAQPPLQINPYMRKPIIHGLVIDVQRFWLFIPWLFINWPRVMFGLSCPASQAWQGDPYGRCGLVLGSAQPLGKTHQTGFARPALASATDRQLRAPYSCSNPRCCHQGVRGSTTPTRIRSTAVACFKVRGAVHVHGGRPVAAGPVLVCGTIRDTPFGPCQPRAPHSTG